MNEDYLRMVEFPAMARDFFDPTPEQQNVILLDARTLPEAERLIESRETCNPEDAQIPFDWILDRVTGSNPSVTDYIPVRLPASGVLRADVTFRWQMPSQANRKDVELSSGIFLLRVPCILAQLNGDS